MKASEIKKSMRVMTEDGAGTVGDLTRKGNECHPATHIPVILDKPCKMYSGMEKIVCYHVRSLKAIAYDPSALYKGYSKEV